MINEWLRNVMVIATAQLYSSKPELRFCASSNTTCVLSEIRNCEDLWSRLEIRLNAFRWSTKPQKQFIIIIITIIYSNFKNWKKYVFHWEKQNFAPTGNFAHTTEFLTWGKALLIILPLYLQMIIMQNNSAEKVQKYKQ